MEGSKSITLTIQNSNILDRVKSGAYYVGEATKGELLEVAAMLQASADDDTILKDFLKEASSKACNVLQRYIGTTSVVVTALTVVFTTAATVNFFAEGSSPYTYPVGLDKAVTDYMANYILREWTKPIPATSNTFAEKVVRNEQTIRELACHRMKPNRS